MSDVLELPVTTPRQHRGKRSYLNGLAAEDAVERYYNSQGCITARQRWRGAGAEIDLIFNDGDRLVFVEVKAGATFDAAAQRIGWPQIRRIMKAAEVFAGQRGGLPPEMRIDVALVDGGGAIQVIENVSMAA